MQYKDFDTSDFLIDEKFKRWILYPCEDSNFFWQSFLKTYPEKTASILKAQALLLAFHYPEKNFIEPDQEEQQELYEKILKYHPAEKKSKSNPRFFLFPNGESWMFRVAAVVVMALLGSFLLYRSGSEKDIPKPQEINLISKSAIYGQKLTTVLPDGSVVKLNSGSMVSYSEKFTHREVVLEGEAFFEVVKDIGNPFVVKTGNIRTIVLGTSFSIKNYSDIPDIEVAVLSGKVSVNQISSDNNISNRIIVNPMQMVIFKDENLKLAEGQFSYNQVLGWKDNLISFHNAGFEEIMKTLERWYGVQFIIRKDFSDEKDFSGEYQNKSLATILEGLSYTFNFKFNINGKTVTLE